MPGLNRNQLTNETAFKGLQLFPQNLQRQKRTTRGKYARTFSLNKYYLIYRHTFTFLQWLFRHRTEAQHK